MQCKVSRSLKISFTSLPSIWCWYLKRTLMWMNLNHI